MLRHSVATDKCPNRRGEVAMDDAHNEHNPRPDHPDASASGPAVPPQPESATPNAAPSEGTAEVDPEVDTEDLQHLVRALEEHLRSRAATGEEVASPAPEVLRACCLTLIAGPSELGTSQGPSPACDRAWSEVPTPAADQPREAEVCRLWWLSAAKGEVEETVVERFAALAASSLWEPVEALACRGLAHFGRRRTLARVLAAKEPQGLTRLDLWMEAASPDPPDRSRIDAAAARPVDCVTADLADRWKRVLQAEWKLATEEGGGPIDPSLLPPTGGDFRQPTVRFGDAVERRVAARALAAAIRSAVAAGRVEQPLLEHPAAGLLPLWERELLSGLLSWRLGDRQNASGALQRAFDLNPFQTSTRLALASLIAPENPDRALALLEHDEMTRPVRIARAALLARTGRYDESAECLAGCEPGSDAGSEAVRTSWGRGRAQAERRYRALATALAEHFGDWTRAQNCLHTASAQEAPSALRAARTVYQSRRELASPSREHTWRRSVLEQKCDQGRRELADVPLLGDARFFHAIGSADTAPDRAANGLRALLHQRRWLEAELAAGGKRILAAGDALLRLGCVDDAVRAYQLAAGVARESTGERLAVATIYSAWRTGAGPQAIVDAAARAEQAAPESPWPSLVAGLALLGAGEVGQASARLEAAEQRHAPQNVCRCLRAVMQALDRQSHLTEQELADLGLPPYVEAIVGVLCAPDQEEVNRFARLVESLPDAWIERTPTDPMRLAWRLAAAWCDAKRWDDALRLAALLGESDRCRADELAGWVRLRQARDRAARGELQQAEQELQELEAARREAPG